jgi:hypothetical protein
MPEPLDSDVKVKREIEKTVASLPVMSIVKYAPPPRFEGAALATPAAVLSWLDSMSDHLARMALISNPWSDEIALELAISFMSDEPRKIAKRCQKELAADANWKLVSSEVRMLLAPQSSPFSVLDRLTKCSQGESTLAQFITEFSNRLEDAIEVGFSDCMSACKWFVEGLEFDLRVAVMETLSSQLEDPWIDLRSKKPTKAVRDLAKLAMRRLDVVELKRSKVRERPAQLRVAVAEPRPVLREAGGRGQVGEEDWKVRREAFVKACANRYSLAPEVVRERIRKRVCVRCAEASHHVQACPVASLATSQPKANAH